MSRDDRLPRASIVPRRPPWVSAPAQWLRPLYKERMRAVMRAQARQPADVTAAWRNTPGDLGERAALVMMARNEADIVAHQLLWHHHLGLRRFVIADNGSTDRTRALIEAFRASRPDAQVVIVDDPITAYVQDRKTTGLAAHAASLWPLRWVLPLDADEFLTVRDSLAQVLDAAEAMRGDVLTVPALDHVFEPGRLDRAEADGPFFERLGGHLAPGARSQPKVAIRWAAGAEIEMGNHDAWLPRLLPRPLDGLALGIALHHYPVRSLAHLRGKVEAGGRALALSGMSASIGRHWREWHARWQAGGDAALREILAEQALRPGEALAQGGPDLRDIEAEVAAWRG